MGWADLDWFTKALVLFTYAVVGLLFSCAIFAVAYRILWGVS